MSAVPYRPEIDGLRAIAVVPVIFFHLGFKAIPGGFLGVDVFFVISGYLITSIIQAELEAGTFTFHGFWTRRIKRIVPALLTVVSASLIAGWLLLSRAEYPAIGKEAMATLLGMANIYFYWNTGDYWGPTAENSLFLQTWSLSLEEQFYLIFPVVLWRFARRPGPGWFLSLLLTTMILVSSLLFWIGTSRATEAAFYLLPARVWELATGALLAKLCRKTRGNTQSHFVRDSLLGLTALAMICASYVWISRLGGRMAPAIAGAAMVIAFAQRGPVHQLLSLPPLLHIGRLSYSLYLWHWPLIVFQKKLELPAKSLVILGLTYILSLLTYHLVEQPARKAQNLWPRIGLAYLATLGLAVLLACSSGTYDTSEFEQPEWEDVFYNVAPRLETSQAPQKKMGYISTKNRIHSPVEYKSGGYIVGPGHSHPRVVILGDSHGSMWSKAIQTCTDRLGIKTAFWSLSAVDPFISFPVKPPPFPGRLTRQEKYDYDLNRLEFIKQWKPDLVIFCSRWSGKRPDQFKELLTYLAENCKQVLIMEQPPELAIGDTSLIQYLCYKQLKPEPGLKRYLRQGRASQNNHAQRWLRDLAICHSNCSIIPTFDLYTRGSEVLCLDGKSVVYVDDDHLTTYGTQLAIPRIQDAISKALEGAAPSSEKLIEENPTPDAWAETNRKW